MQEKLMLMDDRKGVVVFAIACECGDMNHSAFIYFTNKDDEVQMEVILPMTAGDYYDSKWQKFVWRVKKAWTLLWDGYVDTENNFLLSGPNARAFKEAISYAEKKFGKNV